MVEQVRGLANDAGLRTEVFRQAAANLQTQFADLRSEQGRLEREIVRHHADIRKLAAVRAGAKADALGDACSMARSSPLR